MDLKLKNKKSPKKESPSFMKRSLAAFCALAILPLSAFSTPEPIGVGVYNPLESFNDSIFVGDRSLFPDAKTDLARCHDFERCLYYDFYFYDVLPSARILKYVQAGEEIVIEEKGRKHKCDPIRAKDPRDPDTIEVEYADPDGDGIINFFEGFDKGGQHRDTDGDGNPDYTDRDSDFDGIKDINEDEAFKLTYRDCDRNGVDDAIDDALNYSGNKITISVIDLDGDGLPDAFNPTDTDGDGTADYIDIDSDNDGIPDRLERNINRVSEWDYDSGKDLPKPVDTDGDCIPDFRDIDSDGDFIGDTIEHVDVPPLAFNDGDIDGIDDAIDVDLTNGIDSNNNNVDDDLEPRDSDQAGQPDYIDLDSDADSLLDSIEADATGLNIIDDFDLVTDTDGDLRPDYRDLDSDNDGLNDVSEVGSPDINGDGLKDIDITIDAQDIPDQDGDEIPDHRDVDLDNDGVFDHNATIVGPYDGDDNIKDGSLDLELYFVDPDEDGIATVVDHRPEVFGTMLDMDFDGIHDGIDLDDDNDGIPDVVESLKAETFYYPGYPGDDDGNNGGDNNGGDNNGGGSGSLDIDSDNDGRVDRLDRDSDNDGITDTVEGYLYQLNSFGELTSLDVDGDGVIDGFTDLNQDGLHDEVDVDMVPSDVDEDGTPDYLDLDTDSDNLLDLRESTVRRDTEGYDQEVDGVMDSQPDLDIDGLKDIIDLTVPGDPDGEPLEVLDDDNDGNPNFRQVGGNDPTPTPTPTVSPTPTVTPDPGPGTPTPTPTPTVTPTATPTPTVTPTPSVTPTPGVTPTPTPGVDPTPTPSPSITPTPTPGGNDGLETAVRGAGSMNVGMIMALIALLGLRFRRRFNAKLLSTLGLATFVGSVSVPSTSVASAELCGVNPYPNEEQGDFDFEPCFYGGIGLGQSDIEPEGSYNGWSTHDNHDTGYKLFLGFHFAKHLFAEFSYSDLGEAELRNSNPNVTGSAGLGYEVPAFFAGYITDLTPRLDVYAKAGVSLIQNEARGQGVRYDKENDAQLAFGLGLQYRLTDRLFARLELDSFDRDAKYFGVALGSYLGDHSKPEPEPVVVAEAEPTPEPMPFCKRYQGEIAPVYFDSDKSDLTDDAQDHLIHVAGILNEYTELNLEIRAHADSTASDAYNMALTERRAKSVVDFIVSHNISNKRLKPIALGESQPVADNSTKAGRALNRRAEFIKIVIKTTDNCIEP